MPLNLDRPPAGCGVFGRDEGGSEFAFTQQHIDGLVLNWTVVMEGQGFAATTKPDATRMLALELCVSGACASPSPPCMLCGSLTSR